MAPTKPPRPIPRSLNKKPPAIEPTTPTTMSPKRPNPPPRMIFPANQPDTAPIARNISKLMVLFLLFEHH
jgi:hypothetical protein